MRQNPPFPGSQQSFQQHKRPVSGKFIVEATYRIMGIKGEHVNTARSR